MFIVVLTFAWRRMPGLLKSGQRARCSDELSEVKQRFSFSLLHGESPAVEFGSLLHMRGGKPRMKSKCPSWQGKAPVRPRCQGRGLCVHRSEAQSLDRRSGRIWRRIWPGSAWEERDGTDLRGVIRFFSREETMENLRKLFGDNWFKREILGPEPNHLLGNGTRRMRTIRLPNIATISWVMLEG
jgi:hypothetical protein